MDAGFFDPAREAGLALPAREAGLAADAGLADAFEAGFAEALDAGLAAAFEAGLDAGAALLAGLEAALEAGLAYTKNKIYQYTEKIKRVKKLKEKKGVIHKLCMVLHLLLTRKRQRTRRRRSNGRVCPWLARTKQAIVQKGQPRPGRREARLQGASRNRGASPEGAKGYAKEGMVSMMGGRGRRGRKGNEKEEAKERGKDGDGMTCVLF